MLRRLSLFAVVLACALAPALPSLAEVLPEPSASCCDGDHCCNHPDCAPPASVRVDGSAVTGVVVISRAVTPRAASRVTRVLFAFVSPAPIVCVSRTPVPFALASAASVPLFTAHCSFLL